MILKQFLDNTSPTYLIPIEPDAVHKVADTGGEILTKERKSWYLQAIGKLMYLSHTRPDIVFSVHKLAQFSSQPFLIHESALKRILDISNIQSVLVYNMGENRFTRIWITLR